MNHVAAAYCEPDDVELERVKDTEIEGSAWTGEARGQMILVAT